jgi:hypothetical protein
MNPYERPVVDRLLGEVAQIPLPPRERWTPPERRRSRLLPALAATFAVVALAVIIAAPALERLPSYGEGVGAAGPSTAPRAAALACATPDQATSPACRLITGRVVEVLGPQIVRITPDTLTIAADFENPALFEGDARTRIEPGASSIGTAGVKPGGRVQVAFDSLAPKTASGAYTLTRFVVVSAVGAPDCTNGSPLMDIARFPQGATHGGASPEAAFRSAYPAIRDFELFPYGLSPQAPVWVVAGTDTYEATILQDGTWFISPAKFVRCVSFEEIRTFSQTPGSSPNASSPGPAPTEPPPFPGGRAPTAAEVTPQRVALGMPAGAAIFARTDPTCALSADAATFRCTLSRAPAPEMSNFLDVKEPLAIGGRIAGGCLGLDRSGMGWDCYIGQDAVDRAIIGQNLLGQPAPYPTRG